MCRFRWARKHALPSLAICLLTLVFCHQRLLDCNKRMAVSAADPDRLQSGIKARRPRASLDTMVKV